MSLGKIRVFVDSDVVISALISKNGAAHLLICETTGIVRVVSDLSITEIGVVVKRMKLSEKDMEKLLERFEVVAALGKSKCKEMVHDVNDAHVVAGAFAGKVDFLVTYNLKDYDIEKIKRGGNILVMTPGKFLQYLRSR
jgi:putative PIN family toxin of toxin-antitoxin system